MFSYRWIFLLLPNCQRFGKKIKKEDFLFSLSSKSVTCLLKSTVDFINNALNLYTELLVKFSNHLSKRIPTM